MYCVVIQALVAAQMKIEAERESKRRPWEENELSALAKAITKFPAGSQNREEKQVVPVVYTIDESLT